MPKIPSLEELLAVGAHYGHQTSRWHPKMAPYLFGSRNNVHIIDLEKTQKMLADAMEYVKSVAARGGTVLFVGSKSQIKDMVKKAAQDCGMPYVTERWLGGTLTNYGQMKNIVRRYKTLIDQQAKGELRKYTKMEQLLISREIEEMEIKIGGIQDMMRIPEAMFVVDMRTEKTAVAEATMVGTKIVGICDSNINPKHVDYVIPANDDATKAIELIVNLMAEAIKEGKASAAAQAPAKDAQQSV